jgi:prophage antirepressor-like protein
MNTAIKTNPHTLFDFSGSQVRTHKDAEGNPWFVAGDVCDAIGIKNSRQALTYLDEDEKGVTTNDTLGGAQAVSTVNESGLYALILRSRKQEAKAFRKWITATVLPALRKDGGYIVGEENLFSDDMSLEEMDARMIAASVQFEEMRAVKMERLKAERLRELADDKVCRRNAFRILSGRSPR